LLQRLPIAVHVAVAWAQLWLPSHLTGLVVPHLQASVLSPSAQSANAAHLTPTELSLMPDWQKASFAHVVPPQSQSAVFAVIPVVTAHGAGVVHLVSDDKPVLQ
jgi:hypothetical protein